MSESDSASNGSYLVPTANRPYLPLNPLTGVGIKPMHVLAEPSVWSATLRIEAGSSLPARRNTALVEYLVIEGNGQYASGEEFSSGDYLREENGDYAAITATSEVVVFITNHGRTDLRSDHGDALLRLDNDAITALDTTDQPPRNDRCA